MLTEAQKKFRNDMRALLESMQKVDLTEGYSQSAWDAQAGASAVASMCMLLSDESDEPDQASMIQKAINLILGWIKKELAEVASDVDIDPDPMSAFESSVAANISEMKEGKLYNAHAAEVVPLLERAVRSDGTTDIKIISPGWGTSGYYSQELLEERGPKVFTKGVQMYWDHPTLTERKERPERSLRDLAATLVEDARYKKDGAKGPGLYAAAKVLGNYDQALDKMAPHIGVSINAEGVAKIGIAEGRKGRIVEDITSVSSVDFVTMAGRGGEIASLFESYRGQEVSIPGSEGALTSQVTVIEGANDKGGNEPVDTNERLMEADRRIQEQDLQIRKLREATVLREAKEAVSAGLGKFRLPEVTKARLSESLVLSAPTTDDGDFDRTAFSTMIEEAAKQAVEEIAQITGSGKIRGLNSQTVEIQESDIDSSLQESFKALGLKESTAKLAASGR